ncbi:unnamed protein product [Brachionus calyciflorus]|uniref:Uncharacterized protein n=1 Tax=Brachionus calyciflorus TaxID=104777 RepID=A0A814T0E6_9BILA|nr:unnamed protein product [Brachionus calyciflorus]
MSQVVFFLILKFKLVIESNSYETDEFTSILDKDVEDDDFEDDPNTVLTPQQQLTEQERELQLFSACLYMNVHRVSCSAHTLQLVVKDGLAKSSEISQIVAKICNKVHKSTIYSEILEEVKKKKISSSNVTRWNSQLKMIESILNIPVGVMEKIYQ